MIPFTIVIPALNEEKFLPTLLDSIVAQRYDGKFEIIIVDGGSSDDTIGVAESYKTKLPSLTVLQHDKGVARQRNFGVSQARHNNIVLLDADMKLGLHACEHFGRFFAKHPENSYAVPILYPYDGKPIDILLAVVTYELFMFVSHTNPITPGGCLLINKHIHQMIGGFNETMQHAEDIDYGLRAHRAGFRYHLLFRTVVKGSARRLDNMSRKDLALLWFKWYRDAVKHGAETRNADERYTFGDFH